MTTKSVVTLFSVLLAGVLLGRYSVPSPEAHSSAMLSASPQPGEVQQSPVPFSKQESPLRAPAAPQTVHAVGQVARDGALVFTLENWQESQSLPKKNGGEIRASLGAKLVYARLRLENDGKKSIDIYCRFDFGSALVDKEDRKFDRLPNHYDVAGNIGCNDNLQPGFGTVETIVFEMPSKFEPARLVFWDPNDTVGENKDSFGQINAAVYRLK